MEEKGKKKKKLNIKRVIIVFAILFLVPFLIYKIFNTKITNIYINGNYYIADQDIMDIAKINNYPNTFSNSSSSIVKRLEKNKYIYSANVHKTNFFKEVYISIKENYPLFYSKIDKKVILYDGKYDNKTCVCPTLINKVPDTIYQDFVEKLKEIDFNILNRISEIEYKPNEVDEERFILFMNDGNYVYITLRKIKNINKYVEMLKSFDNKKGILHLDSGEYFKEFEK